MEKKQRCQYTKEGIKTFGKQRQGTFLKETRLGLVYVLWDENKTPTPYHPDFIELLPTQGVEEKYHHIDHTHCWNQKSPACGQKIEHLKCCLCEKLNPKAQGAEEKCRCPVPQTAGSLNCIRCGRPNYATSKWDKPTPTNTERPCTNCGVDTRKFPHKNCITPPSEEKGCCEKCKQFHYAQVVPDPYCGNTDCPCHTPSNTGEKALLTLVDAIENGEVTEESEDALKTLTPSSEDGLETRGLTENHEAEAVIDQMRRHHEEANPSSPSEELEELLVRECGASSRIALPAIEAHISSLLTQQRERLVREIEGMRGFVWYEHGRDCEEGRRPCGAVDHPEKLADRCQEHRYDRKTINAVLSKLSPGTAHRD